MAKRAKPHHLAPTSLGARGVRHERATSALIEFFCVVLAVVLLAVPVSATFCTAALRTCSHGPTCTDFILVSTFTRHLHSAGIPKNALFLEYADGQQLIFLMAPRSSTFPVLNILQPRIVPEVVPSTASRRHFLPAERYRIMSKVSWIPQRHSDGKGFILSGSGEPRDGVGAPPNLVPRLGGWLIQQRRTPGTFCRRVGRRDVFNQVVALVACAAL